MDVVGVPDVSMAGMSVLQVGVSRRCAPKPRAVICCGGDAAGVRSYSLTVSCHAVPHSTQNFVELLHYPFIRGFDIQSVPAQARGVDLGDADSRLDLPPQARVVGTPTPLDQPSPSTLNLTLRERGEQFGLLCKFSRGVVRKKSVSLVEGIPDPVRDVLLVLEMECLERG